MQEFSQQKIEGMQIEVLKNLRDVYVDFSGSELTAIMERLPQRLTVLPKIWMLPPIYRILTEP